MRLRVVAHASILALVSVRALAAPLEMPAQPETLLCPLPTESQDGLAKFRLARPMRITTNPLRQDLPEGTSSVANPIARLELKTRENGWIVASLSPFATVTASAWMDLGGGQRYRLVTFAVQVAGEPERELRWEFSQDGTTETLPLSAALLSASSQDFRTGYALVMDQPNCDQDAFQGQQPGTVLWGEVQPGRTARPARYVHSGRNGGPSLTLNGRTGLGGFDKTIFLGIDTVEIRGLLPHTIVVSGPDLAVHAPSHHNWGDQFIIDLSTLTATDREALSGIHQLRIRPLTDEERNRHGVSADPADYRVRLLEGLDSVGRATRFLGLVDESFQQ